MHYAVVIFLVVASFAFGEINACRSGRCWLCRLAGWRSRHR